ncbi:MAG: NAD(P)/FAD-dependent oxidoreductase [Dehalococcoidia bacterium]
MPDAIVIGAGIIGSAVACRLAERGVGVTILERKRPAAGTTSTSFAWANAHNKRPKPYHDLNAAGVAEHHRIALHGAGGWFHATGCLQWADDDSSRRVLRHAVEQLKAWDYRAEWIDAARAATLEPDLSLPADGAAELAFFPDEGWVEAPLLVHHLLDGAARAGALARYPDEVLGLTMDRARVNGVATSDGTFHADLVIDCTGRDAGRLLEPLGLQIQRRRSPGLLVISEPVATGLSRIVLTPVLNLRPDGAGRVLVQSGAIDDALETEAHPDAGPERCTDLLGQAAEVLPALYDARVETARLGWRALPGDGVSAVGPVPSVEGYYLVFTHSGITLGPLLGRLVAHEISSGTLEPMLGAFRPDRLLSATSSAPAVQP